MATAEERLCSYGINTSALLSLEFSKIEEIQLTNRIILDLHFLMNKNENCTYQTFRNWIVALFGSQWPSHDPPTVKAIRQSVIRLSSRLTKLKKGRSTDEKEIVIARFLDDEYCLPNVYMSHGRVVKSSSPEPSSSLSSSSAEQENLEIDLRLGHQSSQQSSEVDLVEDKLKKLRIKMYSKHRNDQKKIKRREQQLEAKKKELTDEKKKMKSLQKSLSNQERSVEQMKKSLDCLRHRTAYWRKKYVSLKDSSGDEVVNAIAQEKAAQTKLSEEVESLECENLELRETVEELLEENDEIIAYENGKYKDNIRSCCYELLSLNVGVKNIEKVILSVLRNTAERSVDRLPCKTTLCEMMIESLTVAQAQLGEKLTEVGSDFFTLHTDGTTKFGEHFGTYDVTVEEGTYHLGLRHVFSGSAQTTLDTFLEILDDLDTVCKEASGTSCSNKIMYKIKNTMSDRHAAEKLFCHLLADYRESILPDVVSDWEILSQHQKDQIIRMNSFFCGLHYLVGLAESAEATLAVWETLENGHSISRSSSGTQNLIRIVCKAFHSRGCEKSGCCVHFRTYVRRLGINNIPLAAFRGNRFNIIFYDAAGVFFLRTQIEKYLLYHHNGPLNLLLQSVLRDIHVRVPKYIAGCKALGIIDKVITGPFWRKLESTQLSILDMSEIYTMMKEEV